MNKFRTTYTEEQIPADEIEKMLRAFVSEASHYEDLQGYYEAKNAAILNVEKEADVPNNKIVHPFPKLITDTQTGYFISVPVAYSGDDGSAPLLEKLTEIFNDNNEQEENYDLAKTASIQGVCYELLYTDGEGQPRFISVPPSSMFIVYDTSIEENVVAAVRVYKSGNNSDLTTYADVYDRWTVRHFNDEGGTFHLFEEYAHFWGDVPVCIYANNKEYIGDFEPVLTAIDAYDKAQSNTLNDMEQFTDAFLKIRNMSGTDSDDIKKLRQERVLLLDDDGDADWLVKTVNDTWVENYKNRLQKDIHKFSATPDMSDENFGGNLSGVALRYKLLGMEQIRSTKERYFRKGLKRRIRLICNMLAITDGDQDPDSITMKFNNTLPQNVLEAAQIVETLSPYASKETLLSLLPFIDDPAAEIDKKEAEEAENADRNYARLMEPPQTPAKPGPDDKGGGMND